MNMIHTHTSHIFMIHAYIHKHTQNTYIPLTYIHAYIHTYVRTDLYMMHAYLQTHTRTPAHHYCACRLDTHTTSWTRLSASCREMSMANVQGETRERTSSPSADSNKFVNSLITHTHTHTHTDTHSHIHSLTHTTTHVQLCKELYADRLKSFEDITRVYDFDTFL